MINKVLAVGTLATLQCLTLGALSPAISAEISQVYVSGTGQDTLDCGGSAATACRSISQGVSRAKANGSVIVVGPFSSVFPTLSKSVMIIGNGDVNITRFIITNNVDVTIKGITFNGFGENIPAIYIDGLGKIKIDDCIFANYQSAVISLNGVSGTRVTLNHVRIYNSQYGVLLESTTGATNSVFINDSHIDASTASAVEVRGASNTAVLINSTLSGSGGKDLSLVNGGKAISYGNNVIRTGTPTQTLPNN